MVDIWTMKIESICIYLKVCLFEFHLTEDVILYFACHLMFDRRSRNFFAMTPVVVTVKQFCQSTFYFYFLLK